MADNVRHLLTRGIGLTPGGVGYFILDGLYAAPPVLTEIQTFRQRPQRAKWYLAVHKPASLFSSQIAVTPDTYPASAVTIDAGFNVGDATLASKNMTVWIGAFPGGSEEGKVRLREPITGTVVGVAESGCALIRWTAGKFITVVDEFYPWPKLPRYIPSASQWRMDYDESYTDELENYPPVIRMGPPTAGFLDGGTLSASFVGGSTQYISATPATHEWVFPEGAKSNIIGTEASPIVRAFTGTSPGGSYFTYITTDSNGKSTSGYRLIYTFSDRTGPARVELSEISGGLDKGGYQGTIRATTGANTDEFPDGAEILIFEEASYAGTASTIGGNYPFRTNVVARGWILEDTTTINPFSGDVTFKFATIDGVLDETYSKDIFHQNANPPTGGSEWIEAANLSIDRVAIDWLHNRSTVGAVTDFTLASGIPMTAKIAFQDLPKASLWKQITTNYGDKGTMGYVASDMQGNIYAMEDVQISGLSANLAASRGMAIQTQDRRDVVTIAHPHHDKNALVQLFSVAEDEYTESDAAGAQGYIGARSPGADAYGYFGGTKEHARGLVVSADPAAGQQILTTWAGNMRAKLNSKYPKVIVPMSGNYKFDSVPQKRVTMSLSAVDNVRGIDWTNKSFLPYKTSMSFDAVTGVALTTLEMEETTDGKGGSAITFERIVPMAPQPAPTPPQISFSGGSVIAFNNSLGAYSYYNTWQAVNGGLTGTNKQDRHGARVGRILYKTDLGKIYKSEDYGTIWTDVTPSADPTGSDASAVDYIRYKPDRTTTNNHYFLARNEIAGTWNSWLLHLDSSASTEAWQTISNPTGGLIPATSTNFGIAAAAFIEPAAGGASNTTPSIDNYHGKSMAALDSTHAMAVIHSATNEYRLSGHIITLTGTCINSSPKNEVFDVWPTAFNYHTLTRVSNTQAVLFVAPVLHATDNKGWAKVLQWDGGTGITYSANEQFIGTSIGGLDAAKTVGRHSSTEVQFVWKNRVTDVLYYRKGQLTGTSLTLGNTYDLPSDQTYDRIDTIGIGSDYSIVFASGSRAATDLNAFLIYNAGASQYNYGPFNTGTCTQFYSMHCCELEEDKALVAWSYGLSMFTMVATRTGASVSFGEIQPMPEEFRGVTNGVHFHIDKVQDNSFVFTCPELWPTAGPPGACGIITSIGNVTGTSVDMAPPTGIISASPQIQSTTHVAALDSNTIVVGFYEKGYSTYNSSEAARSIAGSITGATGGAGTDATSALGLAVGYSGTKGYVTYHDGANLAVNQYSLPDMTLVNTTTLGAATAVQVEANTYTAYPQVYNANDSICYVFGRMDAPAGLGNTPTHIIKSTDAAATFTLVEAGFGADYVPQVFRAGAKVYAIRNVGAKLGALYIGSSSLGTPVSFLPFGIHNEGAYQSSGGFIIVGASEPTSDMIRYTSWPYNRWWRLPGYPDTGEITGITVLSNKSPVPGEGIGF